MTVPTRSPGGLSLHLLPTSSDGPSHQHSDHFSFCPHASLLRCGGCTPSCQPSVPPLLSSVHVLEALLRRSVRMLVPLLPPPPPRRLVDSWLGLWDGRMHELEEHLDMDVLSEGGLFQRRLAAAVAGGEARTCEHLLRMIQLLPE